MHGLHLSKSVKYSSWYWNMTFMIHGGLGSIHFAVSPQTPGSKFKQKSQVQALHSPGPPMEPKCSPPPYYSSYSVPVVPSTGSRHWDQTFVVLGRLCGVVRTISPPTDTVVLNQNRPLLSWIDSHKEGRRNERPVKNISPWRCSMDGA